MLDSIYSIAFDVLIKISRAYWASNLKSTKGGQSHFDHTIALEKFILFIIYEVLEVSFMWIHKS